MNTLFEILISSGCSGIVALVICYIFAKVNRRDEADLKQLAKLQESRLEKLENDRDSMLSLTGSFQQMANNMQELRNMHIGSFWLYVIAGVSAAALMSAVAAILIHRKKRRSALDD